MNTLIRLLRIKQWTKNAFIFFPLIFSSGLFVPGLFLRCAEVFAAFCLISSGVYIVNDWIDADRDKIHPSKSNRPFAAGTVNRTFGLLLSAALLLLGIMMCAAIDTLVLYAAFAYLALHLIYNAWAKGLVILDVIFIAIGFQIRIWAGSFAAEVFPSVWLQMCVFLLALFLGFTKRRYELSSLKSRAGEHRLVLNHYTSYLLDQIIIICCTLTVVFYGLYTMSEDIFARLGSYNMIYSMVFVIYGIFRYLYLVHVKKQGDDAAELLLTDKPLLINMVLWILFITFLIYF